MRHATALQGTPHAVTTAAPAPTDDDLAIYGWLARYSGNTAKTYRVHIRLFVQWCTTMGVRPLQLRRPQIELFLRYCEHERGNQPQTIESRLTALKSFYRCAVEDDYLPADPTVFVKAPKWHRDDTKLVRLGRREVDKLVAAAAEGTPCEEALIGLLLFLGLRNHEARAVRIEDMTETQNGHRVLRFVGKGRKEATVPLPVPLLRSLERAVGDRTSGPILIRDWWDDEPLSAWSMRRAVARVAERAGLSEKHVHPHALRHAFVTMALDLGIPLEIVQDSARHEDPRTTMRYARARHSLDKHAAHTLAAHFSATG